MAVNACRTDVALRGWCRLMIPPIETSARDNGRVPALRRGGSYGPPGGPTSVRSGGSARSRVPLSARSAASAISMHVNSYSYLSSRAYDFVQARSAWLLRAHNECEGGGDDNVDAALKVRPDKLIDDVVHPRNNLDKQVQFSCRSLRSPTRTTPHLRFAAAAAYVLAHTRTAASVRLRTVLRLGHESKRSGEQQRVDHTTRCVAGRHPTPLRRLHLQGLFCCV